MHGESSEPFNVAGSRAEDLPTPGVDGLAPGILLVETLAHRPGHFPVVSARMAEALSELGCMVDLLTGHGWAMAGDPSFEPLRVHEYRKLAKRLDQWAERLPRVPPRSLSAHIARCIATGVRVIEARSLRRRVGASAVVVLTWSEPFVACILADWSRWLSYTAVRGDGPFEGAPAEYRWPPLDRVLAMLARHVERKRRAQGGRCRIVTSTATATASWQEDAPWAEPVTIPLATVVQRDRLRNARSDLGLRNDERVAIYFGAIYAAKDSDTVWEAFEALPGWRLIAAGPGVEKSYRKWLLRRLNEPHRHPMILNGFVDEQTKDLLYSAADLAVISFRRGRTDDSATVTDAISWGIPMVCSDPGHASETVQRYGLGELFAAGDPTSLAAAVRRAPNSPDSKALQAARNELSLRRMACRCLAALDVDAAP
jgi:glycosyltransferase involved in cell wall biosynthesis